MAYPGSFCAFMAVKTRHIKRPPSWNPQGIKVLDRSSTNESPVTGSVFICVACVKLFTGITGLKIEPMLWYICSTHARRPASTMLAGVSSESL